jgi:acyl-CoA synthetase (NDP forming)
VAALLDSDEVDALLLVGYFGGYAHHASSLAGAEVRAAREIVEAVTAQDKPVVVHSIFPDSASVRMLADSGIPVHRGFAEAARTLAALCVPPSASLHDDLALPDAAPPLLDTGYVATRELLAADGVPFPGLAVVESEEGLRTVLGAQQLRHPLVLKAMGLLHKSDAGGVVLGLRDEDSVLAAYADLRARLDPPAVTVEEMADLGSGVEVIVGVQRDPRFGPVLMVGLGGVLTEVLGDVAFALAPASPQTARELLASLRGAAILRGVRGRPAVDLDALAEVVAAVSRVAAEHPEIGELEVNPVLAGAHGCLALDARAVPVGAHPDPH